MMINHKDLSRCDLLDDLKEETVEPDPWAINYSDHNNNFAMARCDHFNQHIQCIGVQFAKEKDCKTMNVTTIFRVLLEEEIVSMVGFHDNTDSVTINNGDQCWLEDNVLHRNDDLPALISKNGHRFWYKKGIQDRDNDLPAIILSTGDQYWMSNGKIHRDNNKPAIIFANGDQCWMRFGKLSCKTGTLILYANGKKYNARSSCKYYRSTYEESVLKHPDIWSTLDQPFEYDLSDDLCNYSNYDYCQEHMATANYEMFRNGTLFM